MLNSYSSLGGDILPKIDHRAFPFEDTLGLPLTIKERRLENYPTLSSLASVQSDGSNSRLEFNVQAVSDSSMYDLHNSFFQFNVAVPNITGGNTGLTQFFSNNMLSDCQVYFGSVLVSEPHSGNVYPYQAFVKDIMTEKRPCAFSVAPNGTTGCYDTVSENALEEGNYLSYSLTTHQTADGATTGALAYTNAYCTTSTISVSLRIKDGVFQTSKMFPANMNLRIVLNLNLQKAFQENPAVTTISAGGASITNAQFMLSRCFLSDDSQRAQNQALMTKPYTYILPYSKVETKLIQAGQTIANITGLFQGQTRPDVLAILFQNSTVASDKTYPLVSASPLSNSSPVVSQLYVKVNGIQYPKPTANPLTSTDIRTYREYVQQCLTESDQVYLDYNHWKNHYNVFIVSLRDDMEKFYGLAPSSESGSVDIFAQFGTALASQTTMICVALTHSKLEIDDRSIVRKTNYIN